VITEALPIVAPPTPVPPTIAPPTPVPPTIAPPTPVPRTATPRPLPTEPPPTAAAPEPPPIGRRQWLARAGRDRRLLLRDRRTRYTIQLELVCELASLDEAWRYDRRGAMWLLTASHRGRECFRVFWGRYATLDEARAAKSGVPRFFFTPTNQPVVVSTRGALLR
jgi:septal ring-binding cell division protein DamX